MVPILKRERPLSELLGDLRAEVADIAREELVLVKREMKEKLSSYGKGATGVIAGAALAYTAVLLLLTSFGWILAYAFQTLGMNPVLSVFLGMAVIGILVLAGSALLAVLGLRAVMKVPPAPQRTLRTLKGLTPSGLSPRPHDGEQKQPEHEKLSADELEQDILATAKQVRQNVIELENRFRPEHLKEAASKKLRKRPYFYLGIAFGTMFITTFLWARRQSGRK